MNNLFFNDIYIEIKTITMKPVVIVIKTSLTASLIFCPCFGRNVGSRIITYLATSIALRLTSLRISACVNGPGGDNSSSTLRPSKISNLDKVFI